MVSNEQKVESLRSHKSLPFYKINQYLGAFLRPPEEAGTKKLWELQITIYGLCGDSSAWYLKIKGILQNVSASKNKFDDAFFYWYENGKLEGIMC